MAYFANSASGSVSVQVSLWALTGGQWIGPGVEGSSHQFRPRYRRYHATSDQHLGHCGECQLRRGTIALRYRRLIISYLVPDWGFSVTAGANYTLIDLPNSSDNPAFPEYWIQTTAQATNGPFRACRRLDRRMRRFQTVVVSIESAEPADIRAGCSNADGRSVDYELVERQCR